MLNLKKLFLTAILCFCVDPTFAHEGHDHGLANVPLQKGGVMRALETVNVELVYQNKSISIYPFGTKPDAKEPSRLTPADPAAYPVTVNVVRPRGKKQKLELKVEKDRWFAAFDPGQDHRFTVIMDIKQGGHQDVLKWTVEPGSATGDGK